MAANVREQVWGTEAGGQLSFAQRRTRGGPRKGAGRKAGTRPKVRHVRRAEQHAWCPVHVTLRRAKALPSLRNEMMQRKIRDAVRSTRREDFRIVEYSVQADHVHMVVEADDKNALATGMKTFAIRAALSVNAFLRRRRGALWGDRYHRRDLGSPRQVRRALVYVLSNHIKHGELDVGVLDPCSSAPWFQGFHQILEDPPDPPPVERARTWLLDWGWHRGRDYIYLGEAPSARRH